MSATLLERLFPASERSNVHLTLKTSEGFEWDAEPVYKRRKLSSNEIESIPKPRAASTVEVDAVPQWLGSVVPRANSHPTPFHSRSWSLGVTTQKTSSEPSQSHRLADQRPWTTFNAIQPHLLQKSSFKKDVNSDTDFSSRKRNSSGNIEHPIISPAMSTSQFKSGLDISDESNDNSHLAALSAISDQVLNGVRLTTHERDLIENLIPTTWIPLSEADEDKDPLGLPMTHQVTIPSERVFQGFAIGFDNSEEEEEEEEDDDDDSSSDFSNFFDLDEASEEKSPQESSDLCG